MANIKEVKIKVEGKEWKEANEKALTEVTKKIKIDGFRKGKAPKNMVIKQYGQYNLWLDAANECIQGAYEKMLDDNKDLEIVARPDGGITAVDDDYVEFTFTLTLKPEIKLGKYKNLGIKKEEVKVSAKEVNEEIERIRTQYAELTPKEGKIEDGDTAVIDFEGFKGKEAFEGGKGENYSLTIGSNTFIPGFEEQLIGMKKGEEKKVKVTFPEDNHSEYLNAQPVIFNVKVNDIKTTVIPELNKEFFDDLGMEGIEDEKSFKAQVKENLKVKKETTIENKYMDELLDKAVENMKVDIPHAMIHDEIDRMLSQYEQNLQMQGITLEQFYQFTNSDEETLKNQMHGEAEKRVASRLLLEEIAKEENVSFDKKEVDKEAKKLADTYKMEKEEFLKAFGGSEMIEYDLKMRKAIEILKESN